MSLGMNLNKEKKSFPLIESNLQMGRAADNAIGKALFYFIVGIFLSNSSESKIADRYRPSWPFIRTKKC